MKKALALIAVLTVPSFASIGRAQTAPDLKNVVELDLLTTTEVADKLKQGMTSVIVATGGTEVRGPYHLLSGHTIMTRHRAIEVAKRVGNTLVPPVLPIAVAATGLRENTTLPGGLQMPADVFKSVQLAMIESHGVERLQGHLRDGRPRRWTGGDEAGGRGNGRQAVAQGRACLLRW